MNIQEAMEYLNFCDKNGCSVDIEGMTDAEIIALAEEWANKGELYADAQRKNE